VRGEIYRAQISLPGYPITLSAERKKMSKQSSWLSFKDVLEELGVARSTMNDWRARGQGPRFVKLPGGQLRLSRVEYDEWCANLQEAVA
jgi:predicted DNA-binding transcriptional regulator AlpA